MPKSRYRQSSPYLGRKRGRIALNNNALACDRVVYLPFDLAIIYAAVQNFRIDLAKGIHPHTRVWEKVQGEYQEEALHYMKEDGCNLYPGDNDEPWIHVRTHGQVAMPSNRAKYLNAIFDLLFSRDDPKLFNSEFFPHPREVNTNVRIECFAAKVSQRFKFH